MVIDRRRALLGTGLFAAAPVGLAGYAVAVEPALTPAVRTYAIEPASWPAGLNLRLAVIADIHACEPWMSAERIHGIALQVNALQPDAVLILGDSTPATPS